jgi:hypothetical protein
MSQMAGVVLFCVGGGVVAGGLQLSSKQLCVGARYVAQEFGGPGEQVGSKRGIAGIPGGSPPSWVSPHVFLLPVVIRHTSHPSFEGRRAMVVGLLFGTLGGCSTTGN